MVSKFKLAAQGWDNLLKIANDGIKGVKDVLTPSGGDIIRQVKAVGGGGPAPAVVKTVTTVPEVVNVPDIIPDLSKYGKYVKYAAIGGAALLAYSVLKK